MLSNRLTFSLASLVVLLVFAFGAMPVMGHEFTFDGTNPDRDSQNELTTHNTDGTGHSQVTSIAVNKSIVKAGDKFKVTVTFAAAKAAVRNPADDDGDGDITNNPITTHAITNPTALAVGDLSFTGSPGATPATPTGLTGTSRTVRGAADGVGASYEITVTVPAASTDNGAYEVSVTETATLFVLDNVSKPSITLDTMMPTVTLAVDGKSTLTAADKKSDNFTVSIELSEGLTPSMLEVEIDPSDNASAGSLVPRDRGESGKHEDYDLPITLATDLTEDFDGNLEITVTATDAAGNEGEGDITVPVMITGTGEDGNGDTSGDTNSPPVVTITTSEPTTPVTTRSFSIAYTATDTDAEDTVTVSASHTVIPSSAATHYTVSSPANNRVTITQAAASATVTNIPAASVTVTLTANDGTVNSAAASIDVEFAADTYTAPSPLPTVTIKTAAADLSANFDVTFTFSKAMMTLSAGHIVVANGRVADGSVVRAHTKAADAGKVWKATIVPYTDATRVTVDIDATLATSAAAAQVPPTITITAPDQQVAEGIVQLSGSIAKNGFVVLAPAITGVDQSGLNRSTTTIISGLNINLERFFINGGQIHLIAPANVAAKVSDVVISEIMWGSDDASDPVSEGQWIEFYNTTGGAISLAGWIVEFLGPRGVTTRTGTIVDTVTNYGPTGFWQVLGHSGRSHSVVRGNVSLPVVDIVSMYRNIDYDKVEKTDHDTTDAAKNRKTQLEGVPDGDKAGSWKSSERPSLNIVGLYQVGTPGAKHYTRLPSDPSVLTQNVIINEVGNGTGDDNDWVELMNTTTSEINLKKWELSIVTLDADGAHSDKQLVSFPDNDDTKLPANGILLITNTSPADSGNDLAAGTQINIKATDQVKRGVSSLYYVDAGLKLPDSGKSLLVLRNANDKEGKAEALIDAGGTLFVEVTDTKFNTEVWPLQATTEGHGDVIDGDPPEDFRAGYVYKRNAKNSGIGEHHWARVGFTGIGYDRRAAKSDENGGTPGFANDALQQESAKFASGTEVTISEVMVEAGATRRSLPQWVELYNSSMTQGVNLDGWELEIQNANAEDVEARLNTTIVLKAMTIAPNQTVLIVSTSGLNSGSDHFPGTRVVNLWTDPDHRDELEMTRRNDRVISATGFYLKLTDNKDLVVDEAGNLDGNRRTADAPAWALPMSSEENRRSSMIRVYEDGVALDGTEASGWVAASDTSLAFAISHTYFGSADDFGTPGFRGGGPLPVSLSSFRPARDKATGAVVIRWATESELDNAGFNILRSESKTGEFKVVNLKGIIPGHGTTSEKHTYSFTDTSAKPNVVYYYQIEDVSLDGKRTTLRTTHLRGNVNAAGKATTTWADLKTLRK